MSNERCRFGWVVNLGGHVCREVGEHDQHKCRCAETHPVEPKDKAEVPKST